MTQRIKPILFSAPMVRALIDGRKTQTRRVLRIPSHLVAADAVAQDFRGVGQGIAAPMRDNPEHRCGVFPPYAPGDLLWVRETWAVSTVYDGMPPRDVPECGVRYAATDQRLGIKDRPSIFMPRWASRLTLEVTAVKVERLQDISEADAQAEGLKLVTKDGGRTFKYGIPDADGWPGTDNFGWPWVEWRTDPRDVYFKLWDRINGTCAHKANPWVVAVTFRKIAINVDDHLLKQREVA